MTLLCFLAGAGLFAAGSSGELGAIFGGADNLRLVREASAVDACILRHIPPAPHADGSVHREEERYEETAFVPVDADTARQLRALLLDPKTYVNADHTGSHQPQYHVRLRFHGDHAELTVDFCFLCKVLRIERDGKEAGGASFAGNADLIVQHAARPFPNDAALQAVAHEH